MSFVSVRGALAGLLVVVIAAVCVRLGFWQLDRLEQRRARNAEVRAGLAAPPLALDAELVRRIAAHPDSFEYRRARAEGVWEQSASLLLRGRARRGQPGVHLVTPLRLAGESGILLVDRGWLPAADANTADPRPYREPGDVAVEGLIRVPPDAGGDAEPLLEVQFDGVRFPTYQRLDPERLQGRFELPVLPFHLERTAPPGGAENLPFGAPPPELDEGPHLGYAFQWFSFATIAVVGFMVMVVRSRKKVT